MHDIINLIIIYFGEYDLCVNKQKIRLLTLNNSKLKRACKSKVGAEIDAQNK